MPRIARPRIARVLALIVLTSAIAAAARAQVAVEAIPKEFLQQFAAIAVGLFPQQIPNPPVKVDPNPELAVGCHVMQKAALVIFPDKAVTDKTIGEAGEKETPLGIVSTLGLTVDTGADKLASADDLYLLNVDGSTKLPILYFTVKSQGADRILSVYSKAGKALATTPLKKGNGNGAAAYEVTLKNIDHEKQRADAVFTIQGYEATLRVGRLE